MSPVPARLFGDKTIHELRHDDAGYHMRTYFHEPDADRDLTPAEAMEWMDTVKRCGGVVMRPRQEARA